MSKPARPVERPVEDVLQGSLADTKAGRVKDFGVFLTEMDAAVRRRTAEIEAGSERQPAVPSGS